MLDIGMREIELAGRGIVAVAFFGDGQRDDPRCARGEPGVDCFAFVAEEKHFQMTPEQFKRFCRAPDAPPAKSLKAMRRLLNEPSVLDE